MARHTRKPVDFGWGFVGYLRDEVHATSAHPGTPRQRRTRYLIAPRARASLPRNPYHARWIIAALILSAVLILAMLASDALTVSSASPDLSNTAPDALPDIYAWTVEDNGAYLTTDCERVTGACRYTALANEDAVTAWVYRLQDEFTVRYLDVPLETPYRAHGVYTAVAMQDDGSGGYMAQDADDNAAIDAVCALASRYTSAPYGVAVYWQA